MKKTLFNQHLTIWNLSIKLLTDAELSTHINSVQRLYKSGTYYVP